MESLYNLFSHKRIRNKLYLAPSKAAINLSSIWLTAHKIISFLLTMNRFEIQPLFNNTKQ